MMLALSISAGSCITSKNSGVDIVAIVPIARQEDGTVWVEEDSTQAKKEG